jgi:hypothetical protein
MTVIQSSVSLLGGKQNTGVRTQRELKQRNVFMARLQY